MECGLFEGISNVCGRRGERERELRRLRVSGWNDEVSGISSLAFFFRRFASGSSLTRPVSPVIVCKSKPVVAFSFSFWRFHINFLTHFSHKATFTKADLLSPCSTYENGSSNVVNEESWPGKRDAKWRWHRVFPHVVSPEPERTSSSVLQRSANCHIIRHFKKNLLHQKVYSFGRGKKKTYVAGFVVFEITNCELAVEVGIIFRC